MATTTNLSNLVINYLTQAQYDAAAQAGTLNENQIYLTPATPLATVATSGSYSDLSNKPTNVSSFTNDAGYLTSSDIASVLKYKGTKASYSALPSSGNVTGDVWHLTDTGAEWAWDGSAWQELGTAIDLSDYVIREQRYDGGRYLIRQGYNDEEGIYIGYFKSGNNTSLQILDGYISITGNDITFDGTHICSSDSWVPTDNNDFTTKAYVDDSISAVSIPTKTSDLTNDSGFLTSYTETDPTVPAWAKASTKPTYTATEVGAMSTSHAANGITSTDISNWNAKVSDDKTWNGVTLNQDTQQLTACYVPTFSNFNSTSAKMTYVTSTPNDNKIVKWDSNSYLYSTTPSANDNSTKVATTAYVDRAIPDTSSFLTLATLPIYNGTVV